MAAGERPGWGLQVAARKAVRDFFGDDIPGVAAGVTFYCILALFPALSAMMSLYGLFADVGEVRGHILALRGPADCRCGGEGAARPFPLRTKIFAGPAGGLMRA